MKNLIINYLLLANTLSVTNIDWTEDENYVQYTGENKHLYTVKLPCKYSFYSIKT